MLYQTIVEISTFIFFILSAVLSFYLTKKYIARKEKSYLFWSIGMWIFSIADLLELIFAFNIYSQLLAKSYLFLVAILTNILAIGSIELVKSNKIKKIYYVYSALTIAFLFYITSISSIGNIVINFVVTGVVPINIIVVSSLITFPAMLVLIGVSAIGYIKTKRKNLLWIILGVLIVGIGGTLYIAAFPAFLYYVEFIGLVMLWLGFFDFNIVKKHKTKHLHK